MQMYQCLSASISLSPPHPPGPLSHSLYLSLSLYLSFSLSDPEREDTVTHMANELIRSLSRQSNQPACDALFPHRTQMYLQT